MIERDAVDRLKRESRLRDSARQPVQTESDYELLKNDEIATKYS